MKQSVALHSSHEDVLAAIGLCCHPISHILQPASQPAVILQ
jgi:hypothetical protein